MKQSTFEYLLDNNPLRAYVKEHMEVKLLRSAAPVGRIHRALEIGCGNGVGTGLIMKHFSPEKLYAVDRNDELIATALRVRPHDSVTFSVQDVCALGFDDGFFDAVFDLADLHNIENWKEGLSELSRVLAPGGYLFLEEISIDTFTHGAGKVFRRLTDHPYETMMSMDGFLSQLRLSGFEILRHEERYPFGLLKYFIVIAKKSAR